MLHQQQYAHPTTTLSLSPKCWCITLPMATMVAPALSSRVAHGPLVRGEQEAGRRRPSMEGTISSSPHAQ